MKMHLGLFLFVISFSFQVRAQNVVHDPNGVLPSVRAFLGRTPFEKAFHCGEQAQIKAFIISCSRYVNDGPVQQMECETLPQGMMVSRQTLNCTPDSVSFMIDVTGDMTELSRTEFLAANENSAETFLSDLVRFTNFQGSEVAVTSTVTTTYTLARGTAQERVVPAINVAGEIGIPGERPFSILITVIRDAPIAAQVVRFRIMEKTWFLETDFTVAAFKGDKQ